MLMAVNNIAAEWYVQPGRRDEFKLLLHANGKVVNFVSEGSQPQLPRAHSDS